MSKQAWFYQTAVLLFFCLLLSACQPALPPQPALTTAEEYGYPWWNDVVFYEIFVRSFYDSDGDGIGDFNGIREKLDYLNDGDPATDTDLEITGIWLMPITPSPSYHGYDVTDFKAVNPEYGTMEDFEALVAECHERGIKVIIDWEINHTSSSHPWFVAAEADPEADTRDWYIWVKEEPDWVGPWGQDVWYRSLKAGLSYYAIFWEGMPDLNYENPEVTDAMYDAIAFWIEEKGIDGIRIDAARHLIEEGEIQQNTDATHAWYADFYQWYNALDDDMMTIGEVWDASAKAAQFVNDQELDLVFNFDLAGKLLESADNNYGLTASKAIVSELKYFPEFQMGTFLSNHDTNRTMTDLGNDYGKAKSAATLLLTAPGIPFVYYGEEIGMMGGKPDENIRRPMQWNGEAMAGFTTAKTPWKLPQSDYTEKNVALQDEDETSLLNHYRALINARNQYPALRIGDYYNIKCSDVGIYAAMRSTEEQTFIILHNMTPEVVEEYTLTLEEGPLPAGTQFKVVEFFSSLNPRVKSLTVLDGGGFAEYAPLSVLEPYTTYILWLQP